jgi:peptidoglycan/LPS O-acetylase OafA/YrhL
LLLAPAKQVPLESVRQAPGHLPALDGIRGAAAASVFIYHYGGGARSSNFAVHLVGETIHLGWAGVSLFFVLSGFLITGILLDSMQRPHWWRTFYIRRTLRIFPLYYTALLGSMLVHLSLRRSWSSVAPIWPYFFYLQDIPGLVRFEVLGPLFTLGHFWSLAVEEQFYLVWPFLLSLANRRDRVRQLCLSIYLLSLIFRICVFGLHLNSAWAIYFLGGRAGEMAAGGFLAALLHGSELGRGRVLPGARSLLVASAASLTAVVLWTRGTQAADPWLGTIGIALFSLLFAALIALSLQPGIVERIFRLPVLGWLGRISYGIYVYHLLLYPAFAWLTHELLPRSTGEIYLLELAAVATVGTLSAAAISFAILESSFLRLKGVIGKPYPFLNTAG